MKKLVEIISTVDWKISMVDRWENHRWQRMCSYTSFQPFLGYPEGGFHIDKIGNVTCQWFQDKIRPIWLVKAKKWKG